MKFRNPETGDVFEDITEVRFAFCELNCRECPISCWNNADETRCDIYCHNHPVEAALTMGYKIVNDTPSLKANTQTKEKAIKEIAKMLVQYNITIQELVDHFANEVKNLY